MSGQQFWKRWAALCVGGLMVLNAATVLAAPVELSLDDSIALALKNNQSIKTAMADKENARWSLSAAKAGKGLTADITHTAKRFKSQATSTEPSFVNNNFDNSLVLTVPLYTGGNLEGKIEYAQLGLTYADLGLESTMQQVKLDTTTDYFTVLQDRNLLKVNQDSVVDLTQHLKNVQAQYDVGTVAKSDLLSSQVQLANAQQDLTKAQNNYDLAVANLNNVTGLPLNTEIKLKEDLKYEKYTQSLDDCIRQALANRPEVKQTDVAVAQSQANVKIAKAGRAPNVNLQGSEDWNDQSFPGVENNNWTVAVIAKWTIFDSNSTGSQIKQADASLDKAQHTAQQTKDSVQLEVRQAYLSMREAEKRIQTSSVTVNQAQEDYKINEVRYSSGVGTNLDVIDAQLALTQAKTNYIQALYDYNTSKAQLEKAMGVPAK